MRDLAIAIVAVWSVAFLAAQDAAPRFDVVSIKRSPSLDGGGGTRIVPGGRFVGTNVPAIAFVSTAYSLPSDRVTGGPEWLKVDRYDFDARATGTLNPGQLAGMVKELLRDRFAFAAHTEMRPVPVYMLVEARADKALGPRIRPSRVDCNDPEARRKAGMLPNGSPACGMTPGQGHLAAGAMTMSQLAQALSGAAGRPVINRTVMAGVFDLELDWARTPEQTDGDRVPIFTAVQEQLGLKLQSEAMSMEVLVIDHIERPSEN